MPYTADISRANPACFLFLIDQSRAIADVLAGQRNRRMAVEAINSAAGKGG